VTQLGRLLTKRILNGCVLGDYTGSSTYHCRAEGEPVQSVVDLCICSARMFVNILVYRFMARID
jgi:hypothetical protein